MKRPTIIYPKTVQEVPKITHGWHYNPHYGWEYHRIYEKYPKVVRLRGDHNPKYKYK